MSCSDWLLETADSYFALPGTKKVRVLSGCVKNGAQGVVEDNYSLSKLNIALKIASLFTIFIVPFTMLLVKFIARSSHQFYIIKKDDVCNKITEKLRNSAAHKIQNKFRIYLNKKEKNFFSKKRSDGIKNFRFLVAKKKELDKKAATVFQKHYRRHVAQKVIGQLREKRNQEYYKKLCRVTKSDSCGSKHDNLLLTRQLLFTNPEELVCVPAFFGFTDKQISLCLGDGTKRIWNKIKTARNLDYSKQDLLELQNQIRKDILAAQFFTASQKEALLGLQGKNLIVRSSSHEDGNVVNAGGNQTLGNIKAEESALKKAIADVVASYFSYPSLKNRSEFGEVFDAMPPCSVLVMEQIIEQPLESPVISGVMMTHKPNWSSLKEGRMMQISATYGFGEGVVSGTIPSDEWVITDSITYATVRKKPHRIRLLSGGSSSEVINDSDLREKPVLSQQMLDHLKQVALVLVKGFGYELDIEFVVHGKKLYIVQARPIQASKMEKTTYLDPDKLPEKCEKFFSTPILSGTGKVFSVKENRLLFSPNLEYAISSFKKEKYDAVIVHTAPQASNSHAAVNFSSYRPPIACFALSKVEWEKCRDLSKTKECTICSQTGVILAPEQGQKVPVCEGLFAHPASSPLSIGGPSKSVQAGSVDPGLEEVDKLLSATPETLVKRVEMISKKVEGIFKKIIAKKTITKTMHEMTLAMQKSVNNTIDAMRKCCTKAQVSHLALHATMLRKMLHQKDPNIVSGHSLAGIQSALAHTPQIESFIEKHSTNETLVELAFFGSRAFDEELQKKWLDFLTEHVASPKLEKLYTFLQEIDAINMAPFWFSFYLADKIHEDGHRVYEIPKIESLIQETDLGFLQDCSKFDERFQNVKTKIEKISSKQELEATWQGIQEQSKVFLVFMNSKKEVAPFQKLYLNRVLINLINLWDLHIKTVSTSQLLEKMETDTVLRERITQFAQFGQKSLDSLPGEKEELRELLKEMETPAKPHGRKKFAGIEHWLVPRSRCCGYIETEDQRLSVIHQNLLQAAQLNLSPSLLPSRLAEGNRIFHTINKNIAKRYGDASGTFLAISEENASIKINVPLNLHSCVVTLSQSRKKGEPLTISSYWRASDNLQSAHKDFLLLFSRLMGIHVRNTRVTNEESDLEVVFTVKDDKEIDLVSRAIFAVNCMSLFNRECFTRLVQLVHPEKLSTKLDKAGYNEKTKATQHRIWDAIWDWFKNKRDLPGGIDSFQISFPSSITKEYFAKHRDEIQNYVIHELTDSSDDRPFIRNKPFIRSGFLSLLTEIAQTGEMEKIQAAMWDGLVKRQLQLFYIPKKWQKIFYSRLCTEAPKDALIHCQDEYYKKQFRPFVNKIRDAMLAGKKLSQEEQALVDSVCDPVK